LNAAAGVVWWSMSRRIRLTVKPLARQEAVTQVAAGEYQVSVRVAPRHGEANRALIELLAEYFCVPKSKIHIIRGYSARRKLIEID